MTGKGAAPDAPEPQREPEDGCVEEELSSSPTPASVQEPVDWQSIIASRREIDAFDERMRLKYAAGELPRLRPYQVRS